IVQVAGVAQGTFYLYFPSKLSVMPSIAEVMVEKIIEEVDQTVQEDAPFSKKLEQMVDAIFKINHDYHEVQALIYAGLASTEHIKEIDIVNESFYHCVSELINDANETRRIRETINVKTKSKLMIALIESAAEQMYLYDTNKEDQAKMQKSEVNAYL